VRLAVGVGGELGDRAPDVLDDVRGDTLRCCAFPEGALHARQVLGRTLLGERASQQVGLGQVEARNGGGHPQRVFLIEHYTVCGDEERVDERMDLRRLFLPAPTPDVGVLHA